MALGGMAEIGGRSPQGPTLGLDNPGWISANRGRRAERCESLKHGPVGRRKREDVSIAAAAVVIGEPEVAVTGQQ
jgi:hypothetical protein